MLFGTFFIDPEKGENVLTIFHHSELKDYTNKPHLFTPPGGLTIWRIRRLIEECKRDGKDYRISSGARYKLLSKGIF